MPATGREKENVYKYVNEKKKKKEGKKEKQKKNVLKTTRHKNIQRLKYTAEVESIFHNRIIGRKAEELHRHKILQAFLYFLPVMGIWLMQKSAPQLEGDWELNILGQYLEIYLCII